MSEDNPLAAPVKKPAGKARKIPKKITERYLYNAGLAYLQRFPASSAHFKTVMGRRIERSCRHHPEQDAQACHELLDKLTARFGEMGYLNDALYLRGMVNSLRGRGLSSMAILMKLKQKGLEEEDIRAALAEHDDEYGLDDQAAALRLCRRKKIGPYAAAPPADAGVKQKWLAALARAGFSYETALRALESDITDLP